MLIRSVVNLLLLIRFLVLHAHSSMIPPADRNSLMSGAISSMAVPIAEPSVAPMPYAVDRVAPSPSPMSNSMETDRPAPSPWLAPSPMLAMAMGPDILSGSSRSKVGQPTQICIYKIDVKTGNEWGAGTDSTISMRLTSNNSSDVNHEVYFELPDYDSDSNKFEAGNDDTFQVNTKCVTHICRMILYTDHDGWFADWYVDNVSVTITDGAPAELHSWNLHQWLPSTGGPLSIVKDDCN